MFRMVADRVYSWDRIPDFGCFRLVISGFARLGYYNPYDWHKGMKHSYDILARAPKSAPFLHFFRFRNMVMGRFGIHPRGGDRADVAVSGESSSSTSAVAQSSGGPPAVSEMASYVVSLNKKLTPTSS